MFDVETPPRAWGRREQQLANAKYIGNTPTCVGKTNDTLLTAVDGRKHPHVRGEDLT